MPSPAIAATTKETLGVEEGGSWCGGEGRTDKRERPGKRHRSLRSAGGAAAFCQRSCGRIISTMTVKSAALFALIGMILLTVLLALGFIRDVSGLMAGAIAAMALLISLIHLLASLSVTIFLYVFHEKQS